MWSFYQEPDAGLFLQEAYRYFGGETGAPSAKGIGVFHLLREALSNGGPHLLVLDGLERVQRQEEARPEQFGQIEDPLLKALLIRIADGMGQTTALITSRFPLPDLQAAAGQGYRPIDIGGKKSSWRKAKRRRPNPPRARRWNSLQGSRFSFSGAQPRPVKSWDRRSSSRAKSTQRAKPCMTF